LQLRRRTGSAAPRPHAGGKPPVLGPEDLERLRQLVAEDPDATLAQYRRRGGGTGRNMVISRGPEPPGGPPHEKSPPAPAPARPEVRARRREFRREVDRIGPERLIFVDESGVTTAMTPAYGRAPRGERVESSAPASWRSLTFVVAMGLDGIRAPMAYPGGTDA